MFIDLAKEYGASLNEGCSNMYVEKTWTSQQYGKKYEYSTQERIGAVARVSLMGLTLLIRPPGPCVGLQQWMRVRRTKARKKKIK